MVFFMCVLPYKKICFHLKKFHRKTVLFGIQELLLISLGIFFLLLVSLTKYNTLYSVKAEYTRPDHIIQYIYIYIIIGCT